MQEVGFYDQEQNNSGVLTAKLSADAAAVRGQFGDTMGMLLQVGTADGYCRWVLQGAANRGPACSLLACHPFPSMHSLTYTCTHTSPAHPPTRPPARPPAACPAEPRHAVRQLGDRLYLRLEDDTGGGERALV